MDSLIPWLPAIVAVIAAVASLIVSRTNKRTAQDGRREPTWLNLVERVDSLEKRVDELEKREKRLLSAITRVLRKLFDQWPGDGIPDIDEADIQEIGPEAFPPLWIKNK